MISIQETIRRRKWPIQVLIASAPRTTFPTAVPVVASVDYCSNLAELSALCNREGLTVLHISINGTQVFPRAP